MLRLVDLKCGYPAARTNYPLILSRSNIFFPELVLTFLVIINNLFRYHYLPLAVVSCPANMKVITSEVISSSVKAFPFSSWNREEKLFYSILCIVCVVWLITPFSSQSLIHTMSGKLLAYGLDKPCRSRWFSKSTCRCFIWSSCKSIRNIRYLRCTTHRSNEKIKTCVLRDYYCLINSDFLAWSITKFSLQFLEKLESSSKHHVDQSLFIQKTKFSKRAERGMLYDLKEFKLQIL